MAETISKHIGEGFGKGELYAALAYDSTDVFGGMAIKAISIGISASPRTITATTPVLNVYTTNALTTGTLRSVDISQVHTGIGASAEALRTVITTNVAGGTYMNAVFGKIDFSTVGKVTGLAGVVCAELTMAGGAVSQGTYATFEAEINLPASYSSSVPISVLRIGTWGTQKADFDTYGYLLDIDGPAVGSGKFFQANTAAAATHALKIRIGGVAYYIMLTNTGA